MRGRQLASVTVLAVMAVVGTEPQGLGVQVNNNALFTVGAGLLALGAGYYIGRQTALNGQRNGYRPYNGGFSPFFGRRRRRQAEPENEMDLLVDRLFQLVLEKDKSGCSLQLTCTIGSRPSSSLIGNAKNLHSILSATRPKAAVDTKSEWSGLNTYQVALSVGRDDGDCEELFPHCPASSQQLMTQFQSMEIVQS